MKTSEALLELAYKASKSGAMSADQALALLRKVEWGVGHDVEVDHDAFDRHPDEPTDGRYGAGDAMPTVDEPAEVMGYTPGSAPSVTEWGGNRIVTGRDEPAERDSYSAATALTERERAELIDAGFSLGQRDNAVLANADRTGPWAKPAKPE